MKSITSSQLGLSLLALVVLGPFCVLVFQSFNLKPEDLETWEFTFKQLGSLSLNSILLVLTTVFFSTLLGVGMALILVLTDIKARKILRVLSILPLAFPLYILAFIYLGIFEYSGVFHTFLRSIGYDVHAYLPIKSFLGIAFVFSLGLFPYLFLTTTNTLCKIGYDQVKAAMSLGKGRCQILWLVILPSLKGAISSGMAIVSLDTLSDFGGVSAFNYDTFTTSIYNAWSSLFSFSVAARLSLFLLIIAIIFIWWERKVEVRACVSKTCLGQMPPLFKLSRKNHILLSIFCWSVVCFSLIVPLCTLILWSMETLLIEWGNHYISLVKNSFLLSLISGIALLAGGIILNLIQRQGIGNFQKMMLSFSLIGYAIPGNVIAVAVFIFMAFIFKFIGWEMGIGLALCNLIVGYFIRFLSVSYRNFKGPLEQIPTELDKVSLSLGQSGFKMWTKLHLPMILPTSWGVFILLFLEVFKEMPLTLMLRPTGHDTLAIKIYELTSEGEWERAAIAGSCLVLMALSITFFSRKRFEVLSDA
jgi:iron(III) transport system permease protein